MQPTSQAPQPWDVYHGWVATTPPKYKFLVVFEVTNSYVAGLVINSRITGIGMQNKPCYAPIYSGTYPFLDYDSWVDCTRAFSASYSDLDGHLGRLGRQTAVDVRTALTNCEIIKLNTQAKFLAVPLPFP